MLCIKVPKLALVLDFCGPLNSFSSIAHTGQFHKASTLEGERLIIRLDEDTFLANFESSLKLSVKSSDDESKDDKSKDNSSDNSCASEESDAESGASECLLTKSQVSKSAALTP